MLNGNDEGNGAGFKTLDEPPLLLPLPEGPNSWEDLVKNNNIVETQALAGYAPSPYVPFRVQVKARSSIPDSELGNVPNSEVRKADDPKGDAESLITGQKFDSPEGTILADASVPLADAALVSPLPVAGSSKQDQTLDLSSGLNEGDLTGAEPAVIALGLQGQDTPSQANVDSNLVNDGLILANGDIDQTLTLAFADEASSGKSGARLTDPLFANPNGPSLTSDLPPGSMFASAAVVGDDLFLDPAPPSPNGASTQASIFSPDDSATGSDGNGNSNPNSQDESFLRNSDPIDWDDPCNLVHGSDTPFFKCTLTTSRTVLAPFKIPTVPRPDNDIAVDIADVP